MRDILRDEWGFDGFVVSDWRSTEEMITHGYCKDLPDVALKSLTAGVDMEMQSSAFADHLEQLVIDGKVPVKICGLKPPGDDWADGPKWWGLQVICGNPVR